MRPLLPLFLLAACSEGPGPPGQVTPGERERLNEAAEMLDANSVSAAALENVTP